MEVEERERMEEEGGKEEEGYVILDFVQKYFLVRQIIEHGLVLAVFAKFR
jgi:hypothetical protein